MSETSDRISISARLPGPRLWLSIGALAWLAIVAPTVLQHAFWRDEVRAWSFAQGGATVMDMLSGLRGEGHPAVWYLLLRAGEALFETASLHVVPALLMLAAVLLVIASPLRLTEKLLILASKFALFEFSVMSRNYGISFLAVLVIVAAFDRLRSNYVAIGILLAILANSNVHSVIIVGAILLFWFIDTIDRTGWRLSREILVIGSNAGIAAIGIVACALTIYPSFNELAVSSLPIRPTAVIASIIHPARVFIDLKPDFIPSPILSLILFGSVIGLWPSRGLFCAGLASLVGFALLFAVIYPGGYRHDAVWVGFLIGLYWLRSRGDQPATSAVGAWLARGGRVAFGILLLLQAVLGIGAVINEWRQPLSSSRAFAAFMRENPRWQAATIMAEPDYMVEPLPYYLSNPLYLPREDRFGPVVKFTAKAELELSLDRLLEKAVALKAKTGRDVLIMIAHDLMQQPEGDIEESYRWHFRWTESERKRFLAATQEIARFTSARSDENYAVYTLNAAAAAP